MFGLRVELPVGAGGTEVDVDRNSENLKPKDVFGLLYFQVVSGAGKTHQLST